MILKYKELREHTRGARPIRYIILTKKYQMSICGGGQVKISERFTALDRPFFITLDNAKQDLNKLCSDYGFDVEEVKRLLGVAI